MTFDDIHQSAERSLPEDVSVPKTWAGIAVWAATRWGIGIVFGAMLIPVYQDLREANRELLKITQANVVAMQKLAESVERMDHDLEKISQK
jgi:hypothetical protein